jgi:3-oxoacyl-[acyl-carrier-protein] synthase-3
MKQHFRITGTGGYLPPTRVSSEELDRRLGLEPGWTRRHTGVANRHRRGEGEDTLTMARTAIMQALESAGRTLADIDLLIDASTGQRQPIPCNAALILEALGHEDSQIGAFDVHGTCLSFVLALNTVNGLFASGSAKRAVIVSSETPLDAVNWSEPESACLMGDGCGAVVVEAVDEPELRCWFRFQTFGRYAHVCEVAGGGLRKQAREFTPDSAHDFEFTMDGPRLHKATSRHMPGMLEDLLREASVPIGAMQVIPHQASGPAMTLLARRLGIGAERLHNNIEAHGNLVAAGIPYALHKAWTKLERDEWLLLIGTAAGYSQGAMLFRR